jgi:hypothetical protein
MPTEEPDEAIDLARRAKTQGKNAIKNAGRAARVAAEPVLEEASDKLEDVAEEAVRTTKRFDPRMLGRISGDTGQAFLALSVAIYAAAIATKKFQGVYAKSYRILDNVPGDPTP